MAFDLKGTLEMGGITCSYEVTKCDSDDHEIEANTLRRLSDTKKATFIENRRNDLQNYWYEQVGQVVEKWNDIAEATQVELANLP